jgi:hypothetical protein
MTSFHEGVRLYPWDGGYTGAPDLPTQGMSPRVAAAFSRCYQ